MTASKEDGAASFEAVFEAELPYVWTSLRRLGVHDRDREDVAHEVFLQAYKSFAQYDAARPIRPWLFAFVFRFASDYRRLARHKTDLYGDDEPVQATAPNPEELLERREREALVARALDTLDIERRAVFVLHELDELAMPEIAAALSIPLNTGYSRLRAAREGFTAALRRLTRSQGDLG